ncbi:MAG: hypothetical protein MZU97_03200 [Bacillus subtilis]|nr:hypothetical protein [Bacillus subtilis]
MGSVNPNRFLIRHRRSRKSVMRLAQALEDHSRPLLTCRPHPTSNTSNSPAGRGVSWGGGIHAALRYRRCPDRRQQHRSCRTFPGKREDHFRRSLHPCRPTGSRRTSFE